MYFVEDSNTAYRVYMCFPTFLTSDNELAKRVELMWYSPGMPGFVDAQKEFEQHLQE